MEKHELSQEGFAKLVGVSQAMVSQWMTGARPVSAERAVVIEEKTEGKIRRHDLRPDIFLKARVA